MDTIATQSQEAATQVHQAAVAEQPAGWLSSLTHSFNFDDFLQKFNVSTVMLLEMLVYVGAGFVAGFLFKRYFKQVAVGLVLFFLAIKGLEYAGIGALSLNWVRIREIFGFEQGATLETIIKAQLAWMQGHVRQTISVAVGFLIGVKVG